MPTGLAMIATLLPFRAVVFTPVWIYMGRLEGRALVEALGLQLLWGLALLALGRALWRKAAPQLQIQGG
jgi:ABC-type uncharacterized transport system permease subunit